MVMSGDTPQLYSNEWSIPDEFTKASILNKILCNRYVLDRVRVFLYRMSGMITTYEMIDTRNSLSIPIVAILILSNKTAHM